MNEAGALSLQMGGVYVLGALNTNDDAGLLETASATGEVVGRVMTLEGDVGTNADGLLLYTGDDTGERVTAGANKLVRLLLLSVRSVLLTNGDGGL